MKWGITVDVHMLHIKVYGTINLLPLIFRGFFMLFCLHLISSELFFFSFKNYILCLSKNKIKDRRIMSYDYTVNNMKLVALAISYWASIQNCLMFLSCDPFSVRFLIFFYFSSVMKIDEMFVEQSVNDGMIGCVFSERSTQKPIGFIVGVEVVSLECYVLDAADRRFRNYMIICHQMRSKNPSPSFP